jgi:hypothetical protein
MFRENWNNPRFWRWWWRTCLPVETKLLALVLVVPLLLVGGYFASGGVRGPHVASGAVVVRTVQRVVTVKSHGSTSVRRVPVVVSQTVQHRRRDTRRDARRSRPRHHGRLSADRAARAAEHRARQRHERRHGQPNGDASTGDGDADTNRDSYADRRSDGDAAAGHVDRHRHGAAHHPSLAGRVGDRRGIVATV